MSIKEKLEWFRNGLKMLNKKEKIVIILLFISFAGFINTGLFIRDDVKELLIMSLFIFFGGFVFYLFPDTTSILFMKDMKDELDRIFIDDRFNKKDVSKVVSKVFKGVGTITMFCQVPVITLILFSYDVPFVLKCIHLYPPFFFGFAALSFPAFLDTALDSKLLKYVSVNELTLIHIMAIVVTAALFWMILITVSLPAGFIGFLIMDFIIVFGSFIIPTFLTVVGSRQLLKLRKKRREEQ